MANEGTLFPMYVRSQASIIYPIAASSRDSGEIYNFQVALLHELSGGWEGRIKAANLWLIDTRYCRCNEDEINVEWM